MNWSPVFAGRVTPSFCYSKWLLHFGQYLCTPYTPMGRQTLLPPSFFPPIYSRIERFFFSVFLTLVKNQYDVLLFTLRRLWLFRADPLPRWREKIPFVCVCVCTWMIARRHYEWRLLCCTALPCLLLLLPPSPFVNVCVAVGARRRKSTSVANEEWKGGEFCRQPSLYYVLSTCPIVDGWCRSDIGMDDKRSLSVMNVVW